MDLSLLNIPENKIGQLRKKGFESIEDLAAFYPRKYNDFRKIVKIDQLWTHVGEIVSVIGEIVSINDGYKALRATVKDGSFKSIDIVWFNQRYIAKRLFTHRQYVFCGKLAYNQQYDSFSIVAPLFFSDDPTQFHRIAPVYPKIKGMSAEYLETCVRKSVSLVIADDQYQDYMEPDIRDQLGVPEYKKFLTMVHDPHTDEDLELAKRRIVADELFPFVMKLGKKKYEFVANSKYKAKTLAVMERFIQSLPFPLTEDQNTAIHSLAEKMKEGTRVEALVQGDVGCGKTVIATALAVAMAENGYQAAIMCPTSVLAEQHYKSISEQMAPFGFEVTLLTSGLNARAKKKRLALIANGKAQIVVGTHAVISKDVEFKNLALTIVDEEHRFGVEQRDALAEKAKAGVHNISMTATPIPRTIASAVYGDNTDIINVHTMPSGRKPVQTIVYGNEEKVYASMYRQIKAGHQCYVVCPLIEESNSDTLAGVESVEETYAKMTGWFAQYPEVSIKMINGNMKPAEIQNAITEFSEMKCQIIISTTIIEVGVNVPNATVIVIKNAERFGLAQLHQLRGRVGRGDAQSYCVLLSKQKTNPRLLAMAATTDGFEIARKDLELRGTGDIVGTKQSGIDKDVTLILENPELYKKIVEVVDHIFEGKKRHDHYSHLEKEKDRDRT